MLNADAAMATLIASDQPDARLGQNASSEPAGHPARNYVCEMDPVEPESYVLPASCRIEFLADMKRVATDCRREFGRSDDPVGAILQALRESCPDATVQELRTAVTAARVELDVKVARRGGWGVLATYGVTAEIETWLELAKGRIHDLDGTLSNLE